MIASGTPAHTETDGICTNRVTDAGAQNDVAYDPPFIADPLPPFHGTSGIQFNTPFCIMVTANVDANNTNPLLYFYSGATLMGSLTVDNTGITMTVQGVTASYNSASLVGSFQQLSVCGSNGEVVFYQDCIPQSIEPFLFSNYNEINVITYGEELANQDRDLKFQVSKNWLVY